MDDIIGAKGIAALITALAALVTAVIPGAQKVSAGFLFTATVADAVGTAASGLKAMITGDSADQVSFLKNGAGMATGVLVKKALKVSDKIDSKVKEQVIETISEKLINEIKK